MFTSTYLYFNWSLLKRSRSPEVQGDLRSKRYQGEKIPSFWNIFDKWMAFHAKVFLFANHKSFQEPMFMFSLFLVICSDLIFSSDAFVDRYIQYESDGRFRSTLASSISQILLLPKFLKATLKSRKFEWKSTNAGSTRILQINSIWHFVTSLTATKLPNYWLLAGHNRTQLPLISTSTGFNDILSVQEEPINLPTNHCICLSRRSKIWVWNHHKALWESLVWNNQ